MPIDYSRYPPSWKQIRARILERAEHKCEQCGAPNRWFRVCQGDHEEYAETSSDAWGVAFELESVRMDVQCTFTRIVLTVAHLDHDEENWNVRDDRLAALCQRCHLRYDVEEKRRRGREKKYRESLFPMRGNR